MKRIIFASLLVVCLGGLTIFTGLGYFGQALWMTYNLGQQDRELAKLRLYEAGGPGGYSGILAGTSPNGEVWVWGKAGLKRQSVDEFSVYTNFVMCSAENVELLGKDGRIETTSFVTTDVDKWRERARVGDYVSIEVTREGMGGTIGVAREIKSHDWWAFVPNLDIKEVCVR